MELRLLVGVARMSGEGRGAATDDANNIETVDLPHPARALFMAFVDDARTWQADQVFCDELDDLLTERAARGHRLRGGS